MPKIRLSYGEAKHRWLGSTSIFDFKSPYAQSLDSRSRIHPRFDLLHVNFQDVAHSVLTGTPSRSVDVRLGEQDAAEDQPREQKRPDDVDALGAEEGERGPAPAGGRELDETGLQTDGNEGEGEPPGSYLVERAARAVDERRGEEEREDRRGHDETEHELREALPDHAGARPLAGLLAGPERPPDRPQECTHTDQRVLRALNDHARLHGGVADQCTGRNDRGAGVERAAEPGAGDEIVHAG